MKSLENNDKVLVTIISGKRPGGLEERPTEKYHIDFRPSEKEIEAIKKINEEKLLKKGGIIIIETDEPERDIKEIEKIDIDYKIYDLRKYGRASLIFLK